MTWKVNSLLKEKDYSLLTVKLIWRFPRKDVIRTRLLRYVFIIDSVAKGLSDENGDLDSYMIQVKIASVRSKK